MRIKFVVRPVRVVKGELVVLGSISGQVGPRFFGRWRVQYDLGSGHLDHETTLELIFPAKNKRTFQLKVCVHFKGFKATKEEHITSLNVSTNMGDVFNEFRGQFLRCVDFGDWWAWCETEWLQNTNELIFQQFVKKFPKFGYVGDLSTTWTDF